LVLDELLPIFSSILLFIASPIYDSVERKIRARLQSRMGPKGVVRSFLQSWFDLLKLLNKELVVPGLGVAVIAAVELFLLSLTGVALQITIISRAFESMALFVTLLSASSAFSLVRAASLDNPYSFIGAFREFNIVLSVESFFIPALVASLAIEGVTWFKTPMMVIIAIACYVLSSRTPFDIAEAEPELASGVYIELSGPLLAFTLYSLYIRRYIMMQILAYIIVEAFIAYPTLQLLLTIVLVPMLWLVFTVISVVLARTRVDVGPRTLFKVMLVLLLIAIFLFVFQELMHQIYAMR